MISRKCILLLLLFQIIFSCKNSQDSEYENIVNEWIGKEILLPKISEGNKLYNPDSNLKIVTRINGNCYSCLSRLKNWKPFVEEVNNKYNIPVFIYMVISDSSIYTEINKKEIHFEYPVIFDTNNEFQKSNNLAQNNIFHTMLLNKSNKVILIGNPINNTKLKELYIEQVINHNNSNLKTNNHD